MSQRTQDGRSVLLSKKAPSFLEEFSYSEGQVETRIDKTGEEIVRPYNQRDRWVRRVGDATFYAYRDEPGVIDHMGDGIVIRRTEGGQEWFFYSDEKTLVVRDYEYRGIPVEASIKERFNTRHFRWFEDDKNYGRIEKNYKNSDKEILHYCDGKIFRENDQPAKVYLRKGKINSKEWYLDGKPGREEDKASVIVYHKGKIIKKKWKNENGYHRIGKPAYIIYNNGNITREEYWIQGKFYNPDGPTIIEYYVGGQVRSKSFDREITVDGETRIVGGQTEGGPSFQQFNQNGILASEYWFNFEDDRVALENENKSGLVYSNYENKPARIDYENGKPVLIEYKVDGKLHRTDGPAIIRIEKDGSRTERYYLNGKSVSKEKFLN